MQRYSFGLKADLTSFDKPAGSYDGRRKCQRGGAGQIARRLARGFPDPAIAGLCVVAFDAAGNLATIVPLADGALA